MVQRGQVIWCMHVSSIIHRDSSINSLINSSLMEGVDLCRLLPSYLPNMIFVLVIADLYWKLFQPWLAIFFEISQEKFKFTRIEMTTLNALFSVQKFPQINKAKTYSQRLKDLDLFSVQRRLLRTGNAGKYSTENVGYVRRIYLFSLVAQLVFARPPF